MEGQEDLLRWANSKGVRLTGIVPVKTPGRGTGVVAQRRLKKGLDILTIPGDAILSLHTIPKDVSRKLPRDTSIHALLAVELALDKPLASTPWEAVLPTLADFEATTPFLWEEKLQKLLPEPAKHLLDKQQARFSREWSLVSKAFPDMCRDEYLHAWFVINTRTFYYVTPQMETYPPDDRLALLPIADLFNHADTGCKVSFTPDGCFSVSTDRVYNAGQEIYISYGSHSNDFLLAEYGFLLPKNRWDQVGIDQVILRSLDVGQRAQLEAGGFLGPFTLDTGNLGCRNTQVALRLLCCTPKQWQQFADGGYDGGPDVCQKKVDVFFKQLLDDYLGTVKQTLESIENLQVGLRVQRSLLEQRWKQIQATVTHTIRCLRARTDPELGE